MRVVFVEMVPSILQISSDWMAKLSKMYCNIWRFDENFQEYRQCPGTKKYFGYSYVEEQGNSTCDCCNPPKRLVEAWDEGEVAQYIWDDMNSLGFSGFMALAEDGSVVGFAWAKILSLSEVRENWGDTVVAKLDNPTSQVLYFSELAVLPEFRSNDYGNQLVRMVLEKSIRDNPGNMTTLLRTHGNSRAFRVFSNAGYAKFSDDTMYGAGRVLMTNRVSGLTPQNLLD